ncbi:MAG: MHYT domain-containing protein [Pseudomonadota bacterium]
MTGTYSAWLQLLSFIVAVIASYVALDAASRVSSAPKKLAIYWLIGGAVSMGTGIWSMHFIAMLAFQLPIQMGYDVQITILSMVLAILASGFALYTINRDNLSTKRLLTSGLVMGCGIASMHYVGMAAMRMSPAIRYDPALYALSIAVAVAASIAALFIAFHLRSDSVAHVGIKRMGAAVVMGVAIVGMHYTGMAAANFAPGSVCLGNPNQLGNLWMAATIAGCTLLFLAATMLISVFDARLASSTAQLARSLSATNAQLNEEIHVRERAELALQQSNAQLLDLNIAAQAANQAKSEFLANVSHELRTPLTLILAPIEQLLALQQAPANWRMHMERIQRNASLLLNRVNDILDFSKAEADRFELHWDAVDLAQLIPAMVSDATPMAQKKGCRLDWQVDPALGPVALDRAHFEKIYMNLLSNALKFTRAGGTIRVEALACEGDCFEFGVTDTGIGIAADKLPLLFNRFQQIDNSATRSQTGTGIGLALVKELAQLMGGTVGVTSSPGAGSRFFVRFPRGSVLLAALSGAGAEVYRHGITPSEQMLRQVRFQEGGEPAPGAPAKAPNPGLPRVLVVDDNSEMRAYICELLAPECNVLTAVNGREAWDLLRLHSVDVVVSDVMMPELDGLGLTRLIKSAPATAHVPVILVTARGGVDASISGLDTGADDYISKPFSPYELSARVRAALRMAQVQGQLREKSREAGMAIVATGILHNLGNILNGVTISSGLIEEKLHSSKIPKLNKVAQLLKEHADDLPSFISEDSRGQVLPAFITQLSEHLEAELTSLLNEVEALRACTEHAVGVIDTQQTFALPQAGLSEVVALDSLMERAITLSNGAFALRGVELVCDVDCRASVLVDSNKVLQILLNLFANARHALDGVDNRPLTVWIRTYLHGEQACIDVRDNGVGIAAKHLPLIFNQGFTTKKGGHGIGLHTSANWARELDGKLHCFSDGLGHGATFTLELPVAHLVRVQENAETTGA